MIHVALIDDHQIFRNGVQMLFERLANEQFKLVFSNDSEHFLKLIKSSQLPKIDVALIDFQMPNINGIELLEKLTKETPHIKTILFTSYNSGYLIESAILKGAKSCIAKNTNFKELLNIISEVYYNSYYITDDFPDKAIRYLIDNQLYKPQLNFSRKVTNREKEVAILTAKGYSYKKIGELLNISNRTVEVYKNNFCNKTGTEKQSGITTYCMMLGWI